MINSWALSLGGRRSATPHHRTIVEMVRDPTNWLKAALKLPEPFAVN
jgi:hypothetical protein